MNDTAFWDDPELRAAFERQQADIEAGEVWRKEAENMYDECQYERAIAAALIGRLYR